MQIRAKKLRDGAVMPRRASAGSAGADLYACIDAPVVIAPGRGAAIPTGIAVELPEGHVGLVCARSGLACRHGVIPANCVGVIDCDYRGEVTVFLTCLYDTSYTVEPGERIAQLVVTPYTQAEFVESDALTETARASGGFGSTGTR